MDAQGAPALKYARKTRRKDAAEIARNMSAIRSVDNKTETALRRLLHGMGLRYRKHVRGMPGRPDIVFAASKVAVFVDGDYWHGRLLRERGLDALRAYYSAAQQAYWLEKLQRNVARDDHVTSRLREEGWLVLRFWESEVRADIHQVAALVARHVRRRARTRRLGKPRV